MGTAAAIGRKSIQVANGAVNAAVLIVILLLLAFSGYSLWDSNQVFSLASAVQYEKYKPTAENKGISFSELQEINPDVSAWLNVYGTHINYPVVQGEDNKKYVNRDALGRYSIAGALFLDAHCSPDFSDSHSIIYGHHMEKNAMFGEIGLFAEKRYFDDRRYGTLHYEGRTHGLEFFAFIQTTAFDYELYQTDITVKAEQKDYLDMLLRQAQHVRMETSVTAEDRIVLLSTCSESTTNGRSVLVAKITDELRGDPFELKTTDIQHPVIDSLTNFWTGIPVWGRVVTAVLLLLILLAVILTYTKRKSKKKKSRIQSKNPAKEFDLYEE